MLGSRQARSNGSRHACGATSWWIDFAPPGGRRVKPNRGRGFQQGDRHLPQPLDALGGGEQRVVAAHRIQDQALVRLQHVADQAGVAGAGVSAERGFLQVLAEA
jgi:hypothetical protein